MGLHFLRQGVLILGVLCGMLLAGRAFAAPDETVIFRYAPPETNEVHFKMKSAVQSQGKTQTQVLAGVFAMQVPRESNDLFHVETTLKEIRITRNGLDLPDEVIDQLLGTSISVATDNHGRVSDVKGDQILRKRVRGHLLDDAMASLGYSTNHDDLLWLTRRSWRERVTRFVGCKIKDGDIWIDTTEYLLLGQYHVPVYRATRFEQSKAPGEGGVLHIKITCNTTADGLAKSLGKTAKEIIDAVDDPLPENAEYRLIAENDMVLNPSTMAMSEEYSRIDATHFILQRDKTRLPETITESMEFRYGL